MIGIPYLSTLLLFLSPMTIQDPPRDWIQGFDSSHPLVRRKVSWKAVRRGEDMIPDLLDLLERDWRPPQPVWVPPRRGNDVVGIGGGWSRDPTAETAPPPSYWEKVIQSLPQMIPSRPLRFFAPIPTKGFLFGHQSRYGEFPESPFDLDSLEGRPHKDLPLDPRVPVAWCLGMMPKLDGTHARRMLNILRKNPGNELGEQLRWALDRHKKTLRPILLQTWKQRPLSWSEIHLLVRNGPALRKDLIQWRKSWKNLPGNRLKTWLLLWEQMGIALPPEFLEDLLLAFQKDFNGSWWTVLAHAIQNGRRGIDLFLPHLKKLPKGLRKTFYLMMAAEDWAQRDLLQAILEDLEKGDGMELRAAALLALIHMDRKKTPPTSWNISIQTLGGYLENAPSEKEEIFAKIQITKRPALIPYFYQHFLQDLKGPDRRRQIIALAALLRSQKAPGNETWPLLRPFLSMGHPRRSLALGVLSRLRLGGKVAEEAWKVLRLPQVTRGNHLSRNAAPWIRALGGLGGASKNLREEIEKHLRTFVKSSSESRRLAARTALKHLRNVSQPHPPKVPSRGLRRSLRETIQALRKRPDPQLMARSLEKAETVPGIPEVYPLQALETVRIWKYNSGSILHSVGGTDLRFDPDLIPITKDQQVPQAHPLLALLYLVGKSPRAYASLAETLVAYFQRSYPAIQQQAGWALLKMGRKGAQAIADHLSSPANGHFSAEIDFLRVMRKTGAEAVVQALTKDPNSSLFQAFAQIGGFAPEKGAPILLHSLIHSHWDRYRPQALWTCGDALTPAIDAFLTHPEGSLDQVLRRDILQLASRMELTSPPLTQLALQALRDPKTPNPNRALQVLLLAREKNLLPKKDLPNIQRFFRSKLQKDKGLGLLGRGLLGQLVLWPDFFRELFPLLEKRARSQGPRAAQTLLRILLQHPKLAHLGIPLAKTFTRGPMKEWIPEALLLLHFLQPLEPDSATLLTQEALRHPQTLFQTSWLWILPRFHFSRETKAKIQAALLQEMDRQRAAKAHLRSSFLSAFYTYLDRDRPLSPPTLSWLRKEAKAENEGAEWVLSRSPKKSRK